MVAPEEIALALAAADKVTDRQARSHRVLALRVEQARYDAARAERAFLRAIPTIGWWRVRWSSSGRAS